MKILELFAGYGSQALALKYLGVDVESEISEIDIYAIQAYNQLHGETHNWGDITKINEKDLPCYDLITYSSPCQDFSIAGLQRGGDKGSGTRSSLLWECERIIRAVKPKYLLMENVKALTSKKFKPLFSKWLNTLEVIGYNNYWQVLNAKDYGVPQNRERVFVVSIRKDVDTKGYKFPEKIPLTRKLKDVLDSVVDEKYYLSQDKVDKLVMNMDKEVSNTIRCGGGLEPKVVQVENTEPKVMNPLKGKTKYGWHFEQEVYDKDGIARAIKAGGGSGNIPKVIQIAKEPLYIKEATKKGYNEAYEGDSVSLDQPNSTTRRGRVVNQISNTLTCSCNTGVVQLGNIVNTGNWDNPQRGRIYSPNGCSPALNTMQGGGLEPKIISIGNYMPSGHSASKIVDSNGLAPTVMENHGTVTATNVNYRIRKLTPLECWRLMGVKDEDFAKLHDISNTQLYKLAGNSIVTNVLMGIFKQIIEPEVQVEEQLQLF